MKIVKYLLTVLPPALGVFFLAIPKAEAGMLEIAKTCSWDFGRTDASLIARNISLASNGRIVGYFNRNENSWEIYGGDIAFRNTSGDITTRFRKAKVTNSDRLMVYGRFNDSITHTLTCH